jgi:ADP-heptose:LPS heptosyltransferase
MRQYTSSRVNKKPHKRIQRLRELLDSHSPHICVVRGEGIGDVLMATPMLSALKQMFNESACITFATNMAYLNGALHKVLKHNPDVDRIIDREDIDEGDYDIVINLQGPAIDYEANRNNPPLNRVDIFAKHAGVQLTEKKIKYFLQQEELEAGDSFISNHSLGVNDKVIMVHIFTSASRRNLDTVIMRDALQQLTQKGFKLILLRHDSDPPSHIAWENIPGVVVLKNGEIRHIAGILKNCDLLLCPDSVMLHLAGAMDVPTVALFGDTDPRARTNYYPQASYVWPAEKFQCRSCWSMDCTMNYVCFKSISAKMIVDACIKKIEATSVATSETKPQTTGNETILGELI